MTSAAEVLLHAPPPVRRAAAKGSENQFVARWRAALRAAEAAR